RRRYDEARQADEPSADEATRRHERCPTMTTCAWCEQEMSTAASCTVTSFHVGGEPIPLPRYPTRRTLGLRCGDCGVKPGGAHHPGCDLARCPLCGGQLFSCGCRFDEDRLDHPDPDDPDDPDGDPWESDAADDDSNLAVVLVLPLERRALPSDERRSS